MFFLRVYNFSFDFDWISENRDEISKSKQFRGPMPRRRDLRSDVAEREV